MFYINSNNFGDKQEKRGYGLILMCFFLCVCVKFRKDTFLLVGFPPPPFLFSLTQARVIREEGTSVEKMPLSDLNVSMPMGYCLDCDLCVRAKSIGGSTTLGRCFWMV